MTTLIEAVEDSFPESKDYAFVAVDGDEVVYSFGGNPALLTHLVDTLKAKIECDIVNH